MTFGIALFAVGVLGWLVARPAAEASALLLPRRWQAERFLLNANRVTAVLMMGMGVVYAVAGLLD